MTTKRKVSIAVLLVVLVVSLVLSGCTVSWSGREGGQNMESIRVETCPQAQEVGAGSCNAKIIRAGRGN